MSYGLKYKFYFNNILGVTETIEIEQEGYTGISSNIQVAGSNPIQIEYSGDGKSLYEQSVFGSKLTFPFMVQTEGNYDEFLSVNDREYRVKYKRPAASETKYIGDFTISQIATNYETGAYVDPFDDTQADFSLKWSNDFCRYTKLRYKIGGVVIATYDPTPFLGTISAEVAIHQLLLEVVSADSSYSVSDENGDGFYDRLIKTNDPNFSETATVEKYYEQCDTNGWLQEGIGAFGNGYSGDNFQLKVDESGVIKTLFDYSLQEGDTKQDIISAAIATINSDVDYSAYQETEDKIVVEHISTAYTLQVSTSSVDNEWNITASGLNEVTTEAETLKWIGFVISGISERPYTIAPYKFILEATDGIADLKNVDFSFEGNKLSDMRALALALQNTGLNIDIYSAADIYEDSMATTVSDDPLKQTFIQAEALTNENCHQIITRILKKQTCELRQSGGVWWVLPSDVVESVDYRIFDYQGNYKDNGSVNTTLKVSNKGGHITLDKAVNVDMDAKLLIEAAVKSIVYKQDYGRKDQLIKDPTFSIFDTDSSLLFWEGGTDYFQNADKYLEFNSAGVKIRQRIDILDQPFDISLSYMGGFLVEIIDNDNKWYDGGNNWVNYQYQHELNATEFDTKKWNIQGHTANNISIWITSRFVSGDVLKSIKATPTDTSYPKGLSQELSYPALGEYKKESREVDFFFGDVPIDDWSPYRYLNLTLLEDDTQTDAWPTNKLSRTAAERMAIEICQNSRKITGTFRFKEFPMAIHNIYSEFDGKYYKLMGGKLSVRNMFFKGKWIEVNKADPGGLVVSDKLFDGEPSGVSTYSTNRESYDVSEGSISVDLSNYLTENEILALLQGYTETFTEADLDSNQQKTVNHNLNRVLEFATLYMNGERQDPGSFVITDDDDLNSCTLTVNIYIQTTDTFEIRMF